MACYHWHLSALTAGGGGFGLGRALVFFSFAPVWIETFVEKKRITASQCWNQDWILCQGKLWKGFGLATRLGDESCRRPSLPYAYLLCSCQSWPTSWPMWHGAPERWHKSWIQCLSRILWKNIDRLSRKNPWTAKVRKYCGTCGLSLVHTMKIRSWADSKGWCFSVRSHEKSVVWRCTVGGRCDLFSQLFSPNSKQRFERGKMVEREHFRANIQDDQTRRW